ncbi:uncharacterized protein LOC105843074 [Hydra vulgaris]|uniref:uncharacterized protein LOC105843074 n=1 Tax=Hydra vulgaris TaxID=6087 RepID=UPI001F5EFB96|nr:uncharacterized protein LOC105843074 [Hydra vulgaris]
MLKVYKIEILIFLLFVSLLLYFFMYFKFNEILHAPSFMRNVAVKLAPHADERHFESIKKIIRLENTGLEIKPPANTTLTPSTIRISNLYSVSLKTYVQAIIDRSLSIQSKHGFIFLQMMNSAFLLHTKSWLCNVKNQNEVLQRLILIATDDHAFKQLKAFNVKVLHLFLLPYESLDLEYGLRSYYEYVLFRISLTNKILNAGVSVWICEADAVWFESPIKYLTEFTEKDIVVQQDGLINQNMPCGGFIFLNKTKPTKRMWRELEKRVTTVLNSLTDVEVGDEGNEQLMLPILLSEFRVKWAFFSRTKFVSGHWYTNELFRKQVHPVVIQNNWIKGNEAKILRAKYWDHWYLNKNETCL